MTRTASCVGLRLVAIAVALCAATTVVAAPPKTTAAEITGLLREFLQAASRNDHAVFDRFFADELIYTRSAGLTVRKPDILESVRQASATPPVAGEATTAYDAEDITVSDFGETAVVNFRLVQLLGGKRVGEYRNTGTLLRRSGRWQVVAWQATRAARSADDARSDAMAFDVAFHLATLAPDVSRLEAMLDEAFVWTHSAGNQVTRAALLDQLRSGRLRYAQADVAERSVSVFGDTAIVRGVTTRRRSARPDGPPDSEPFTASYTLTLAHQGSGWTAVALHTSRR